jgi:glyoxylase-like metal-dependent hydrolase (beta-lactamase superfamily II)
MLDKIASARPRSRDHQAPGFYRVAVGHAVVTVLLDGYIDVQPDWWLNTSAEQLGAALAADHLDTTAPLRISINAYVIETGGRTIAIDAGSADLFGPAAGGWARAFAAAGFDADRVDTVLVSHMHPDHIGGMVAGDCARFPNARVLVEARELAYWTDPAGPSRAPAFARPWFEAARRVRTLYDDRLETFEGARALTPEIDAVPLPGHTPGHTGFLLDSAGERLFLWTDVTDFLTLQLDAPERSLVFDIDPAEGERSRRRAFAMAASERLPVTGAHIPFPGFGHLSRSAGSLRFVPTGWQHEV